MTISESTGSLTWAHIGDLRIVKRLKVPIYVVPGDHDRKPATQDLAGAWPERHLLGTRLGPNRNGRQW